MLSVVVVGRTERSRAGVSQGRQIFVVDLTKMRAQGLIGEEGLGAAVGRAWEGPLVVMHPEVPLESGLLHKTFGAMRTLERLLKRQLGAFGTAARFLVNLKNQRNCFRYFLFMMFNKT